MTLVTGRARLAPDAGRGRSASRATPRLALALALALAGRAAAAAPAADDVPTIVVPLSKPKPPPPGKGSASRPAKPAKPGKPAKPARPPARSAAGAPRSTAPTRAPRPAAPAAPAPAPYDGQVYDPPPGSEAPPRDAYAPPRDAAPPPRDAYPSPHDAAPPPRDAYAPARDSYAPARDSYAPARDSDTPPPDAYPRSRRSADARPAAVPGLPPWLVADAGVETGRFTLQFPAGGTAPVGFRVSLPAVATLRLELYPLRSVAPALAGAGAYAEGGLLALHPGGQGFQATYLRLRGGVLWRLQLDEWLELSPAVGWETEVVAVRTADGAQYPGLPDLALAGPSLGLDAVIPVGRSRFAALLGGRAVWWLHAGELAGGARFFPGGSALGLQADAGVAVRLTEVFSIRVLGRWAATSWTLQEDPSHAYTVRAARADRLGAHAQVRLEL
jgi:hypothetical protein